ncbi:VOC family protein [Terracoccus luteus]|jgi:catechol 2,3-dioxygenase-like lactoylglutathione lyase family enzyme|uniref:Catechol 2,3-dioxygenase-like lactoylglutathione lyase family enzyme n=1 Tax=Terracoccus luteus TaxID=53356 RepID=A0A495XZR4_9MICO|nr:VOC family protein [Terracoccus luteus]MBB2988014.1 catechol 2,3-dioxygenase-like lactoylglutathione lyase family enzyme [Terracoccus luteus]MCP2173665.1 catechol 2,3-dioxygenase-like lactoylglutathione lyase family enzyme [Terracoccus luteus]RKT80121.1 hypothetical protein DFJ68_3600 [Terracoccus luteus]
MDTEADLARSDATPVGVGVLHGVVVDCADPDRLARFYESLLTMVRVVDTPDWVVIGDAADRPGLAFARVADHEPPTWPTGPRPQYRHLDVRVPDLDAAERAVLALSATRLTGGGEGYRVFADPAGHPFCLVTTT